MYIKRINKIFNSSYSLLIVLGFILKFSSIWCRYIGYAGSVSCVGKNFFIWWSSMMSIWTHKHTTARARTLTHTKTRSRRRISPTTVKWYYRPVTKMLTSLLFLLLLLLAAFFYQYNVFLIFFFDYFFFRWIFECFPCGSGLFFFVRL